MSILGNIKYRKEKSMDMGMDMQTLNRKKRCGYMVPPCGDNKKRTVERFLLQGKKFFSPIEILNILESREKIYYKNQGDKQILGSLLDLRDKALISIIVISCCRLNEALLVRKSQLDFSRLDFLLIRSFRVLKRKRDKVTGEPKIEFIPQVPFTMKKRAVLYPYTRMILDYAKEIGERSPLFKIGDRRARQIITELHPDIFPHFLRGCMLTYYLNLIKNPFAVAKMFGIKKVETLGRYYGGVWEDFTEALSR